VPSPTPAFKPPSSLPTAESADEAFKPSGEKPGIEIWRIEKFKVVRKGAADPAYKGKFFSGDSYIILHTKKRDNALDRDIFFWLGEKSSQDEQGCAAYKTVELDEYHGGEPTQHREVQGHESNEFLDLFKDTGVTYMDGGVDSGFKEVKRDEYKTRLLHVKGRRHIHCTVVPLETKSIVSDDVFILDTKHDIFQYNGSGASKLEKEKAMHMTRNIRDQDHNAECRATVHIVEMGVDDEAEFWKAFGAEKPASIPEGVDDSHHEMEKAKSIKLYHLSDASGKLEFKELEERPLKHSMLDTNDAFVLMTGHGGIFAWVGKNASNQERLHAMKYATNFIAEQNLPNWTPVTRLNEDAETEMFKQYFPNWPVKLIMPTSGGGSKSKFKKQTFDHKAMLAKKQKEMAKLPDDGKAQCTVYRMEKRDKVAVPKKLQGQFYAGDSYVILYEYKDARDKEAAFIYFWQGHKSTQDERADSALIAKQLDDDMGGMPVQVRVVQGKEPPHFYKIFESRMVIHEGGIGAGWANREGEEVNEDSYDTDGTRLFHVRGTNDYNTRAVQVAEKAVSLNSGDCFVLETPEQLYLWYGKGCSGDEREFTNEIIRLIQFDSANTDPEKVHEGTEPEEFWKALGTNAKDGRAAYAHTVKEDDDEEEHEPRLFQCSDARGYFWAEEIHDFDQEDLIEEDVMLLDTHREVIIWCGKEAKDNEKADAMKLAKEYVEGGAEISGRTCDDTVFIVINQGQEPQNFTCHFHGWNYDKWSQGKTYEELKAELAASNPAAAEALVVNMDEASAKFVVGATKYPYEELIKPKEELPEGVDATQKEAYLTDEEFAQYFIDPKTKEAMPRETFNQMPKWKQLNMKKANGLF
jgi:hypothetical protein